MQRKISENTKSISDGRKITDYNSRDTFTHMAMREKELLNVATKKVVTIGKTMPIREAAELMATNNIRRIPVVDPGTNKLVGIIAARDILDFMGGGDKSKLMDKEELIKAINEPVRKIMEERVKSLSQDRTIQEAVKFFLQTKVGGAPIVDDDGIVVGILSERDLVRTVAGKVTGRLVRDYMIKKPICGTVGMKIDDACKVMLRNGFRRLPVVKDKELVGMITSMDIVKLVAGSKLFEKDLRIEKIMAKPVITTERDVDLGILAQMIVEKEMGAFPVVENKELVGLITERDLLKAIS